MTQNLFSEWVDDVFGGFEYFLESVNGASASIDMWKPFYEDGPEGFYSTSILNSLGDSAIGEEPVPMTEWLAAQLLCPIKTNEQNEYKRPIDFWEGIKPLRNKTYFTADHNKKKYFELYSGKIGSRNEENLAKLLYLNDFIPGLGNIIDYQVPLKGKQSDKIGKIDLVGYSEQNRRFSLIELKYHPVGSRETLLRCVLEIYTYYKFLDKERFKADFIENYPDNLKGHASNRDELAFDSDAKFELIILFDAGAKDVSDYITGEEIPLLPLEIYQPIHSDYSRQFIEFVQMKENLGLIFLYNLCKKIASKEDIVFRFCKLARSKDSTNEKFEVVKFMDDKDKTVPVDIDWHIGKYYIQDQFIID